MMRPFRRRPHERAGFALYTAAVGAARQPWFYTGLGVPDTLDGRFDMVGVHVVLVLDRLARLPEPGPALGQAVFDAMFADMDRELREIGVSDMTIGRRVRAMWEALNGRATAYLPVLEDEAALAAALARNVWRGEGAEEPAHRLATYVRAQRHALDAQDLPALLAGTVRFEPPPAGAGEERAA